MIEEKQYIECKELIERTALQLTNGKARVKVHEDEHGAVFEVFSPKDSNALLIGKRRATIDSLRILAKALGHNGKHRIKVVLRERSEEA